MFPLRARLLDTKRTRCQAAFLGFGFEGWLCHLETSNAISSLHSGLCRSDTKLYCPQRTMDICLACWMACLLVGLRHPRQALVSDVNACTRVLLEKPNCLTADFISTVLLSTMLIIYHVHGNIGMECTILPSRPFGFRAGIAGTAFQFAASLTCHFIGPSSRIQYKRI